MKPFLLDVNVLIALFDSAHINHAAAHQWFAKARIRGWRSCPIAENGLLRILSNPAYPNGPLPMSDLAHRLAGQGPFVPVEALRKCIHCEAAALPAVIAVQLGV